VDRTPPPQGGPGGADRPGRVQGRRQRLAAALDRAVRDARLTALVTHYRPTYEQAIADRVRPAAEFSGIRGGRTVASIISRPASARTALEPFKLACRILAALDVDSVALLAGDDLALAVTASADHPSDLSPFIIGLIFGPAGVDPAGTLVPYQLDRGIGTVTWREPRPVRASTTRGLWAEELAPTCLNRTAVGQATLAELREENRLAGNSVLLM
jgi:hypothetical protein